MNAEPIPLPLDTYPNDKRLYYNRPNMHFTIPWKLGSNQR